MTFSSQQQPFAISWLRWNPEWNPVFHSAFSKGRFAAVAWCQEDRNQCSICLWCTPSFSAPGIKSHTTEGLEVSTSTICSHIMGREQTTYLCCLESCPGVQFLSIRCYTLGRKGNENNYICAQEDNVIKNG